MITAYIFAGSKVQYDFYVKNNNLNPNEFPNLRSLLQLYGTHNPTIIKVGTYYMNPLHQKLLEAEKYLREE